MQRFLTGSAGFTGSHVVERLLARGERVIADAFFGGFLTVRSSVRCRTEDAASD
jgi:thioester reductase-like protein